MTEAADGSSALHFLEKGSFDLIILDVNLPDGDGLTLCPKLKALQDAPDAFGSSWAAEATQREHITII